MPTVEMTEDDVTRLEHEREWWQRADKEHALYRDRWDHQDVLYFGHKRFVQAHSQASPRDRDGVINDGRKEFGAELHIPYVFSTIETIAPRTLSNRPKMLWLPRDKEAEENAENVSVVCDSQQQAADYELSLQTTNRSGLKHGIGVGKTYWRREERKSYVLAQAPDGQWVRKPCLKKPWDDPYRDDIDIRDFRWDPFGDSMRTVRKVAQRSWRDSYYILEKIQSGAWDRYPLTADDLSRGNGQEAHKKAWSGRRAAMGLSNDPQDKDIHEVVELHDRSEVITIVDWTWIVSIIENPYWHGELPYNIYRPIEIEHQFVGLGVVDPIEDLQREMDWLRTDRRWNAMLKLHQTYAYNDGVVDPAQIKIGPGRLVPVNGDPRDLLVPLQVGDIPNSGYQEEANLRSDIERTTGVDDTVAGNDGGAAQTATGVQLVQAAAGLRIQAYTRRMELELIKPEARQWLALNQQHWIENRDVRFPVMPTPEEPERRWAWREVGPGGMAGEFYVDPEGGATAPDNVPQDRQDAQMGAQLLAQLPGVDPHKASLWILKKMGIPDPESYLQAPQTVPPQTLDILKAMMVQSGMDPAGAQGLIQTALTEALNQQEQGPGAQQEPPQDGGGQAPADQGGLPAAA